MAEQHASQTSSVDGQLGHYTVKYVMVLFHSDSYTTPGLFQHDFSKQLSRAGGRKKRKL